MLFKSNSYDFNVKTLSLMTTMNISAPEKLRNSALT